MSRPTAEDQYQFLLSCVQHSKHGKVDFASVSQDLNITSRGAAAKRYNRMSRLYGIDSKNGKSEPEPANKRKSKASIARAAEAKRRKLEGDHNDPLADDGGVAASIKQEPGIKQERMSFSSASTPWTGSSRSFQENHLRQLPSPESTSYSMPSRAGGPRIKIEEGCESPTSGLGGASGSSAYDADDERIFDDFCNPELFDSGEDSAPTMGNVLSEVGGTVVGARGSVFGTEKQNCEAAPESQRPLPSAAIDALGASHRVDRVAATNEAVRNPAPGTGNNTAAAIPPSGNEDVVVILD